MGSETFPAPTHDHAACRREAMAAAESHLAAQGGRLTEQRRAVLEAMLADHRPLGAYELMERIDWRGRRPAPAAIYRALDFLVAHGLAHKIESINAYMACEAMREPHRPVILICEACGQVAEMTEPALGRSVSRAVSKTGFTPHRMTLEVSGLCAPCSDDAGKPRA